MGRRKATAYCSIAQQDEVSEMYDRKVGFEALQNDFA